MCRGMISPTPRSALHWVRSTNVDDNCAESAAPDPPHYQLRMRGVTTKHMPIHTCIWPCSCMHPERLIQISQEAYRSRVPPRRRIRGPLQVAG